MSKARLYYVDILKGIGILFVIFSHSGAEDWFMTHFGDFFVPLFFIASGYTYTHRDTSFLPVFKKRARRLLLPYFFFSVVLLLLYKRFAMTDVLGVFYSRYCLYPYNSAENVFLMGGGNPPLWFLTSMLMAFIPFWLLVKYQDKKIWILAAFCLVTFGLKWLPVLLPWSIDTAFLTGSFIYAGWLLRRYEDRLFRCPIFVDVVLLLLFVGVCLLNGSDNLSVREYGNSFLLYFLAALIGTVVLLRLSKAVEKTFLRSSFVALGRHSLVIFCIQMFLLRICHQVFHGMMHLPTDGWQFYCVTAVKIVIVAFAGVLVSKVLQRYLPWLFR